ncbi:hypothetical protein LEMA_P104900.1 [Plenodomus lingam JN3]|uniref:Uncharacterized protein n=1 Tax=Leptosphaeria maculans (strain JN3 / isolate v23.1.3 / race Av1-4-5-6-7-8) TaxID=985895 RepID=E5A195_LEPMJ|nr:hypothetical protein LEMA_P104900.1 [Plenodomus lingam JN3]CBX97359.1 hypothetical protein LEMA_P104900.1 [Plenodomus lingam JN3]
MQSPAHLIQSFNAFVTMEPSPLMTFDEFAACEEARKTLLRYDSELEPKPQHPYYQMEKERIDTLLKEFGLPITGVLRGAPLDDKDLQHVLRTAEALSHVLRSKPLKIALVGAQGAGKSLLINATFEITGLSLTGADGAACTSSITRYAYYPPSANARTKLHAEIKFLRREKRNAMLKEHARHYYAYHHADIESDDDEDSAPKAAEKTNMDVSLKDTAQDVFENLFGSRQALQDAWNVQDYRSGEFLTLLQFKCNEALQEEKDYADGTVTRSADDAKELTDKLRSFLTTIKDQRCLWPLVEEIIIRVPHGILQGGLEIIDLPGWGDVNRTRVQHAESIKDIVDVEIIATDTSRISTDKKLIDGARAAVAHHGASGVKVVATRIDSLSKDELSQCSGPEFDEVNRRLNEVDEQENAMEDADDDCPVKTMLLRQYKTYLERYRKQRKIAQRSANLTATLPTLLQGGSSKGLPELYHVSSANYMDWIRKPKLRFENQPALTPEMTGIPAIRELLRTLPAGQNLQDYVRHIKGTIPEFIEKVKRTVAIDERDGGFKDIAEEFNSIRASFMSRLLSQARLSFQEASTISMTKIGKDIPTFKEQIEEKIMQNWIPLKWSAWNRTLKCQGVVMEGASKAQGLQNGCNWPRELAAILTPGFNKWSNLHNRHIKETFSSIFAVALASLHTKVITMMEKSSANVVTIERSKLKWKPLQTQLRAKLKIMSQDAQKLVQLKHEAATMEYSQERALITCLTDDMFSKIFEAIPDEKNPASSKSEKKKRKTYVMSKSKWQKKLMEELFLSPDAHFVDLVFRYFKKQFDNDMNKLLEEHFGRIDNHLYKFRAALAGEAPIDYKLTETGVEMRVELAKQLPALEAKAAELQSLLPEGVEMEEDADEFIPVKVEADDNDESDESKDMVYAEDALGSKKRADSLQVTMPKSKRIKSEFH